MRAYTKDEGAEKIDRLVGMAVADAVANGCEDSDCIVTSFWKAFGSTAGPFGGVGGASITSFPMVVVTDISTPRARVYCLGRLLYEVSFAGPTGDARYQKFLMDVAQGSVDERPTRYR